MYFVSQISFNRTLSMVVLVVKNSIRKLYMLQCPDAEYKRNV